MFILVLTMAFKSDTEIVQFFYLDIGGSVLHFTYTVINFNVTGYAGFITDFTGSHIAKT